VIRPGASNGGRLFLRNAPDANTAAIYQQGEGARGPMVLEYPFIDGRGKVDLPSVEALRSAIVCSVINANPAAASAWGADSAECLVD
jgi:hypothetical protein